MTGVQTCALPIYSSDDVVWISGPGEGFRVIVCFGDEAIDGGLEIDQGVEDAAFELPSCEFGEEAFDGVEPGGGCWREVEYKLLMAVEPGPNLWVLVYGIVIKDDVDGFVRWNLGVDHVQKADRKSTRPNSSHALISYAVFCLKKKHT